MACDLTIWNSGTKEKKSVVCDEEISAKIIEDDHAARATGTYSDISGAKFTVDWTQNRLVRFARRRDA